MPVNHVTRVRTSLDEEWKFMLGVDARAKDIEFDDRLWRDVQLPHDWSIEGIYAENNPTGVKGGFLPAGIGWYRKTIIWEEETERRAFIEFDGIYMNSDVWINGCHVGHRPYGYIGFEYEMTPYLKKGKNVISVRVDCSKSPSGRWYTGCGIYRHVWLTTVSDVYIPHWGTYVTTPEVSHERAEVKASVALVNKSNKARTVRIVSYIYGHDDIHSEPVEQIRKINWDESIEVHQILEINKPHLWSPESPYLYNLKTAIWDGDLLLDEYVTPFGIRFFDFDSNHGFRLNGNPLKFQGVCQHADGGPVGAAVPDRLLEKRLYMLKRMGCNAIRTAHHPMSPEFYDYCDQIGLMVIDEAFDGWESPKMPYDYGLYFHEWWKRDLEDMLIRDRNHPCVIMWSIGNEVKDMRTETTKMLVEFVHLLEPTRPVTCGVNQVGPKQDANRSLLDVAGYNDGGGACFLYEEDHRLHPERKFVATEAPHTFQTRGFYRTQTWWRDKNQPRIEITNLTEEELFFDGELAYNSSYDNSGVRTSSRDSWSFVKKYNYLTGEFRWTGFDYLGESFGWPARSANFGIIDLANFPKDHYYFYQSQFTASPMIHLLPHWTHPDMEGKVIPVWVYTNCEEAELFLNDSSLGRKQMDEKMYLSWDVSYEPGTLKAVGFKEGKLVVQEVIHTAGEPVGINLRTDLPTLMSDGQDLCQVSFEIVDDQGHLVPQGHNRIYYEATGSVTFLGMENGDPLDLTPAKRRERKAFYGLGMGLFQSTKEQGNIEIVAAGIIGNEVFRTSTLVSISVQRLSLRGSLPPRELEVFFTLDGTKPTRASYRYESPITIDCSCTVRAVIYEKNKLIIEMTTDFKRGEREKVIDLLHGNRLTMNVGEFSGPISKQLLGEWRKNQIRYVFTDQGEVYRFLGNDTKQKVGLWWYDFPADPFEAAPYAGTGEIVWADGKRNKISLRSQTADQLIVHADVNDWEMVRTLVESKGEIG